MEGGGCLGGDCGLVCCGGLLRVAVCVLTTPQDLMWMLTFALDSSSRSTRPSSKRSWWTGGVSRYRFQNDSPILALSQWLSDYIYSLLNAARALRLPSPPRREPRRWCIIDLIVLSLSFPELPMLFLQHFPQFTTLYIGLHAKWCGPRCKTNRHSVHDSSG